MKHLNFWLGIGMVLSVSIESAFADTIAEVDGLFQEYGAKTLSEVILDKRESRITVEVGGTLREAYGRPDYSFITPQSLLVDMQKAHLTIDTLASLAQRQKQKEDAKPAQQKITKHAREPSELAADFCYALQAFVLCDGFNMRADTEDKIERQIGKKVRGPESPYNQNCFAGLTQAFEEENKGLCSNAWRKYGCSGDEVPRLLQENPFKKKNGAFCEY